VNKTKLIEIKVKGEEIRPSITPDYPDIVSGLLWEYTTEEGTEYRKKCEQKFIEDEGLNSKTMD